MAFSFQKIILLIAIILLIIILVFIGIALSKSSSSQKWPPIIGDCPDYWIDMSGNGSKCVNTHNLGTCNLPGKFYTDYTGYNSPDNDLTQYSNVSEDQCKVFCTGSKSCYGAAYNTTDKSCYLKNVGVVTADKQQDSSFVLSIKNMTDNNMNSMDFSTAPFTGDNGTCAKYQWASKCNVSWDGITYGVTNPCATTTTS